MSEHTDMPPRSPYRPTHGRRREKRTIDLDGLPSQEELDSVPHRGEDADRFSLYNAVQIEAETRDVRLTITFGDVIKVRDQAEMIIAGMRAIIEKTRQHDIGSIRQRIEARSEAASVGRALTRFNGRTPYGDWKPKPRKA
jgi:hypothetical protein